MTAPLALEDLHVSYGGLEAVRGVTFEVESGKILCLIGETGSGKSSVALATTRLLPPGTDIRGRILLEGTDIASMPRDRLRALRPRLGFVSQDAMAALNPVLPIGRQIGELFEVHEGATRSAAAARAVEMLRVVRIPDPGAVASLYPHQLSGGMRQRVMIAMGLALAPPVVIADEPTTGLDVSVQAEILSLVRNLRDTYGAAIVWITHDMGVVAELADRVAVMYAGRLVELADVDELFRAPRHPYSVALLQTLHDLRRGAPGSPLFRVAGEPPSLHVPVSGCPFHPRCTRAAEPCRTEEPALEVRDGGGAACHFPFAAAVAG